MGLTHTMESALNEVVLLIVLRTVRTRRSRSNIMGTIMRGVNRSLKIPTTQLLPIGEYPMLSEYGEVSLLAMLY